MIFSTYTSSNLVRNVLFLKILDLKLSYNILWQDSPVHPSIQRFPSPSHAPVYRLHAPFVQWQSWVQLAPNLCGGQATYNRNKWRRSNAKHKVCKLNRPVVANENDERVWNVKKMTLWKFVLIIMDIENNTVDGILLLVKFSALLFPACYYHYR